MGLLKYFRPAVPTNVSSLTKSEVQEANAATKEAQEQIKPHICSCRCEVLAHNCHLQFHLQHVQFHTSCQVLQLHNRLDSFAHVAYIRLVCVRYDVTPCLLIEKSSNKNPHNFLDKAI